MMEIDCRPASGAPYFYGRRVWITGHRGMLGSALVRSFSQEGANLLLTSREQLDLTDQVAVREWMDEYRPEFVFHAGAKVGGIYANSTLPADFLYSNLLIQSNVIHGAYRCGVEKLIFVASNCTYPAVTDQPISEDALMTGPLEHNIHWYAIAKISGIEMCRAYRKQYGCNFISVIPPNLYGPGDNYHMQHSHVVAGILRRAHEAKLAHKAELVVWGDGTPRRELLYVDDLAEAMKFLMTADVKHDLYNVGCGHDFTISDLAQLIIDVVGFEGALRYDEAKPNGTMRKLLDSSRFRALGWSPRTDEKTGLRNAYREFLNLLEASDPCGRL